MVSVHSHKAILPWPVNYHYREDEAPARICDIHGQGEVALRSPEQAVSEDPE